MSRLSLMLLGFIFEQAGHERPSDNLFKSIMDGGDPDVKIKGLGLFPDGIASYFHTIRVWSNKADHADTRHKITVSDAENALGLYLSILEWAYEEYAHGPRIPTIYVSAKEAHNDTGGGTQVSDSPEGEAAVASSREQDEATQTYPRPSEEDSELEQFFTNSDYARQVFEGRITADPPTKRMLVVHGVGGVGKSTLLKMYRLYCQRSNVPVALVALEDARSPLEALSRWVEDLRDYGVRFPLFAASMNRYLQLQARVAARADNQLMPGTGTWGKASSDADAGSGAVGTGFFIDWLGSFLAKAESDFYLDPSQRLTDDFLNDLAEAASSGRMALMLDTYEQATVATNSGGRDAGNTERLTTRACLQSLVR